MPPPRASRSGSRAIGYGSVAVRPDRRWAATANWNSRLVDVSFFFFFFFFFFFPFFFFFFSPFFSWTPSRDGWSAPVGAGVDRATVGL